MENSAMKDATETDRLLYLLGKCETERTAQEAAELVQLWEAIPRMGKDNDNDS